MVLTSKTGLLEGVRKPIRRQEQTNTVEFPNFSHPAPYTLRPFAGVYNPFPYGCSILCNHPADCEAKDVVKRAKNSWLQQQVLQGVKTLTVPTDVDLITDTTGDSGDEEVLKRRGKQRRRRKKSGRDGSREPEKEFQGLPEPGETQVSAIGKDSQSTSTRPSLIFGSAPGELDVTSTQQLQDSSADGHKSSNVGDSFIDVAILKQLQRELTQEIIDSEFDQKRHKALKEALNIFPKRKTSVCEELKKLKQELRILPDSTEHLLTLPRNFTRRSSRFELPLDSRLLNTLTPMEYMKSYISISSARLQLYNIVFNRHREELDEDETKRLILGKHAMVALGEVMGCPLTTEQFKYIQDLIGWKDSDQLDFRTWGGLCALCERILAPQLIFSLPSRQEDPCHEVEHADFETLPRKLHGLEPDPRLATILHAIRDL
ncbi:uncharacterized protein [Periplaneta americana]|uniref:uncharacterized protein isoform X2 n=1 Tax=Periplaneta americana TaxID=6978 RepID=UPI0037E92AA9